MIPYNLDLDALLNYAVYHADERLRGEGLI